MNTKKRRSEENQTFEKWFRAVPQDCVGEKTVPVNLTLSVKDWLMVAALSTSTGLSIDAVLSNAIGSGDDLCNAANLS
jgi:hypothetical protein